jgi:hypothetical protein
MTDNATTTARINVHTDTDDVHDDTLDAFRHIKSPLGEIEFWKGQQNEQHLNQNQNEPQRQHQQRLHSRSTKEAIDKVCQSFQDAIPAFEYLYLFKHNDSNSSNIEDVGDNNHQHCRHNHHHNRNYQSFDFLEENFTDGSCIETSLYNIFQIVDVEQGNYIYTAAVST